VYLPHSAGRYAQQRFKKAQCPIVERVVNCMMVRHASKLASPPCTFCIHALTTSQLEPQSQCVSFVAHPCRNGDNEQACVRGRVSECVLVCESVVCESVRVRRRRRLSARYTFLSFTM
jgi:hypothetical protein